MQKFLLIVSFLLSILHCLAQDWKPINPGEKYNYHQANNNYTTIWVDSVSIIDSDSVLFLNTVLGKLDVTPPLWYEFAYYLLYQPQFFLSRMVYHQDGSTEMQGNNGKRYLIKTKAGIGESWVFDSLLQDTATITEKYSGILFGNNDSLKIIRLGSHDSIILSKNSGIIRFPVLDSVGQYVELVGIEGRDAGLVLPKFFDFFDFNPGDQFYYRYQFKDRWVTTDCYKKFTIKSLETNSSSVTCTADYLSRNFVHDNYYLHPDDTLYTSVIDSVRTFHQSSYGFLNNYMNQILDNGILGMIHKPVVVSNCDSFNTVSKSYPYYFFCKKWNSDTVVETSNPMTCNSFNYHKESYGMKLGLIHRSDCAVSAAPWNASYREDLIGCVVDGISYGTIINDSIFHVASIPEPPPVPTQIKIFPNPIRNVINIETALTQRNNVLYINDINGRVIFHIELTKEKTQIDMSMLSKGVYLLKLVNDLSSQCKKIVKQ
jgi:hypothetical protein